MPGKWFGIVLICLACAGCARGNTDDLADFVPTSQTVSVPALSFAEYNIDTPIQTLAANHSAAIIVDAEIPGLLEDSRYPMFKSMSLRSIASYSGGEISNQTLQKIALRLTEVHVATASK